MSEDEQVMNRFESAGKDYQESLDSKDGKDSKSSKDVKGNGGIKDRRESFQAYIPDKDKKSIENVWRKVKAVCSLSGLEEPSKNDFYTAVIRYGYENIDKIADHLNVLEEYETHKKSVKSFD